MLENAPNTKEIDFDETYKNMFSIYYSKDQKNFIINIIGLMNEMLHQVIYKIWKIKQMINVKFPTDVNQLVDSFHAIWKEDTSFYTNKNDSSNSATKSGSQQLVDFFLGKLRKAAEKTYLELIK